MLPFCSGNAVLTTILGPRTRPDSGNADYDWHLRNAPTVPAGPWQLRLLPGFVRTRLAARRAVRSYEDTLIAMWETSPHLLDDIGVVLETGKDIPPHLVVAPARVVDHVAASSRGQAAGAAGRPQVETTDVPRPVAPRRVAAIRKPSVMAPTLGRLPA